ncbi:unnamed protein product, partial [Rotaria magnacalcarata]
MPNTSREKCVMCEESFDQVEMRTIGDGLLRVYVAVRLSKRIFSEDYICQRWRLQFFHWLRVMEGDFDRFCSRDISDNEFFTNDDDKIAMVVDNYEERIVESSVQNDPQTPRISIPVFRCSKSHQTDCWTLDSFGLQVLLTDIRSMLLQQNSFNFDDPTSLNEEAYKTIVGLTKDQFNDLIGTVSSMSNSNTRSIRAAVAIFLAKMRLSLSNRLLAILFHIENKRNVSHIISQDGYILCVMGPFLSDYKNNDASIFKHCVYNNEQDILNWLHDNDVLILDRGFRDTVRAMKQFGFQVAMPSFLNGRKQFSLEEANLNRCITKVRWI